jgi:hypothetical protein
VQLTKEQTEKLIRKISSFAQISGCELCKSISWTVHDKLYELREFNAGTFTVGGPLIPLAVFQCTRCGNMHFLNALAMGLIDPKTGRLVDGQ